MATVSHVLNGTRYVSPELTRRVEAAVAELNYRPSALARGLRRKETLTLGLLVPDNANPFFSEVAKGAEDAGFENGYSVILCNSDGDLNKELTYLDTLISKQVDGVILIAVSLASEHIQPLVEDGVSFVIADRELPEVEADCVLADNYQGGYAATQHLIELGHTRIGCITGPSDLTPSAERERAYRAALREHGLTVDPKLIVKGDFHSRSGLLGAEALMQLRSPPTAIFAHNDLMAIGALRYLTQNGYRVPRDVSLVGFDDIHHAALVNPPITTVVQPSYEMGRIVVDLMLARLSEDPPTAPRRVLLDTHLIVRDSTAAVSTIEA